MQGLDRIRALFNRLEPRATGIIEGLDDVSKLVGKRVPEALDAAVSAPAAEPAAAPAASAVAALDAPGYVQIDSVFQVQGVGTVVAGTVVAGKINAGDTMLLGPDVTGQFIPVTVRTIQVQYTPAPFATAGGTAAFAVRPKGKTDTKKVRTLVCVGTVIAHVIDICGAGLGQEGYVLDAPVAVPEGFLGLHCGDCDSAPSNHYGARICPCHAHRGHHTSCAFGGYKGVQHCHAVRARLAVHTCVVLLQTLSGESMEALRTGDRAIVRCRFMYRPEFLNVGSILLFREGRAKGVGRVTHVGDEPVAPAAMLAAAGGAPV